MKDEINGAGLFYEFFGTTMIVFLATTAFEAQSVFIFATRLTGPRLIIQYLSVGTVIGIVTAVFTALAKPSSGGHFNPAITLGCLITSNMQPI